MLINDDEFATFGALPGIAERFISMIPEEALDRRRGPDAWTIREHIYHIADGQRMLFERIKTIRENDHPVITPYFPEKDVGRANYESVEEAMTEYREFRVKQIALIKNSSDEQMLRKAEHPEYIEYSIPSILRHMIFHEYWHMHRIEELWKTRDEYFS
jgi:uncharacterized damage-inducible protein DinB